MTTPTFPVVNLSVSGQVQGKALTQIFDSVAALRANTLPASVCNVAHVTSFYGSNLVALQDPPFQGVYFLKLSDTSTSDNVWGVIVDNATPPNRWYLQTQTMYSIMQLGGYNDGVTSSSAAFTLAEAYAGVDTWYVPAGVYLSGINNLTKNYVGPGSIVMPNGVTLNGTPKSNMLKKKSGLAFGNALQWTASPRAVCFIGDSITAGTGASTYATCYTAILQKLLNNSLAFGQGSWLSGGQWHITTLTAPYTRGTNGPGQQSVILGVGGVITFTADYVDTVVCYFTRVTSGGGTITLRQGSTVLGSFSATGTAGLDVLGVLSTTIRGGKAVTYTLTCTVAPVELTGMNAYHGLAPGAAGVAANPYFLTFQGFSGYNTTSFIPSAVLTSIAAQNPYPSFNFEIFVLAIGTNDIFNVSTANTSAQFKANLISIITQLRTITGTSCTVILQVPLNALSSFRTPVLEPFDNYRIAVYEVARQFDFDVMDLSELDLLTVGATSDGLHPNDYGHSIIASAYFDMLFGSLVVTPRVAPIVTIGSCSLLSGRGVGTMSVGGSAVLSGEYTVTGIAKGTQLMSVDQSIAPLQLMTFTVPAWGNALGSNGTATITISAAGAVVLYDYTPSSISYISLDGVTYNVA